MRILRTSCWFLVALLGLAALDLMAAGLRLGHPVPDPTASVVLAAARWGLLGVVPLGTAWLAWGRRARPVLGPALVGVLLAATVAVASLRWRGAAPPEDAAAVALEVVPVLLVGALGAGLGGRWPRGGVLLALGAWLLGVAPWPRSTAGGDGPGPPAADAPDVVLVTLDTFRSDALSASSAALVPGLTPTLDAVAAAGCHVDAAMAPAPLTGPSHGALLTGRTPAELGLLSNGGRVDPAAPRLARRFRNAGYATGAFVSSAMVHGTLGYAEGFSVFDDDLSGSALWEASTTARLRLPRSRRAVRTSGFAREGAGTVDRMAHWLSRQEAAPVFVWLHLYDAHHPYTGSPRGTATVGAVDLRTRLPDPTAFASHPAGPGLTPAERLLRRVQRGPLGSRTRPAAGAPVESGPELDADAVWAEAAAYLAGVARTDDTVSEALAALERTRGKRDRLLFVVGDHGESLTEHNELASHQQHLYRANLATPLILPAGTPCPTGPVSTVGVGHAVLSAAGLDASGYPTFSELPVAAWLTGRAHAADDETLRVDKAAVTLGRMRAIGDRDGRWIEVYDLERDPHERDPTDVASPALSRALSDALGALRESESAERDADTRAALEALGYVGD